MGRGVGEPQASLTRGIQILTGGKASNANGGGRIHVAATDLSEGALLNLAENSGVKEERSSGQRQSVRVGNSHHPLGPTLQEAHPKCPGVTPHVCADGRGTCGAC
jgi:hypothetical protein